MRLLILPLLVFAASCSKSVCTEPEKPEPKVPGPFNAIVMWYGAPALDGLGWVLKIDSQKIEKPSNLAQEFQVNGLKVNVTYEPSTEKFQCFCVQGFIYIVKITSISKS